MNSENILKNLIPKAAKLIQQQAIDIPLEKVVIDDMPIWLKREDKSPVRSFKWRGALYASSLIAEDYAGEIVTASAGNHAQGVALAARKMAKKARIFMPVSTPAIKRREVLKHGKEYAAIELVGDSYDQTFAIAEQYAQKHDFLFVPAYDSLEVIAGQATIAAEILAQSKEPMDKVYLPVGGGGIIAGMAFWLKKHWPNTEIIAVEVAGQEAMQQSITQNQRVKLANIDIFCDGTAVKQVGEHTFAIVRKYVDRYIVISNQQVCEAMRYLWDLTRSIAEPSGVIALAGVIEDKLTANIAKNDKVMTVISGANMDFSNLQIIASQTHQINKQQQRITVFIPQEKGTLCNLLNYLPDDINLVAVSYGQTATKQQQIRLQLASFQQQNIDDFLAHLEQQNISYQKHAANESFDFYKMIYYEASTFKQPVFLEIEFLERPQALLEFMNFISDQASICYFNYQYSGERVGRALVGLDFNNKKEQELAITWLQSNKVSAIRSIKIVSDKILP